MSYKLILCPVDGSKLSEAAVEQAVYVAKFSGAKLVLMNVVEKWYRSTHLVTDSAEWQTIHNEWLKQGEQLLKDEAARLKDKGVANVETVVRDGDAAHEIVAMAVERSADLIIMATHRYSPVGKLFMGSVTDKVTRHSPCPVMWVFA